MSTQRKLILFLILIGIATFITFLPCLWNGFTNWDDQELVTGNPQLGSLSPGNIVRIFVHPNIGAYIPLTILSFTVEYQLFRLKAFFYHLNNILLHVGNVLLVFWLAYMLFGNLYAAAAAALFFGLHPLRVESVAWVTERKDVLCGFLYMAALVSYLYSRRLKKPLLYVASLILFVLSVLAKPMAITLPAVILLIDYLQDARVKRDAIKRTIPFLALAMPLGIVNIVVIRSMDNPAFNLVRNFLIGGYNYFFYIAKTFLPIKLSGFYPYPNHDLQTIPLAFYAAAVLFLIWIVILIRFGRHNRHLVFGSLFYMITLLPVSQFIPLPGAAIAADRYCYLPILGIIYLIGMAGVWFWRRFLKNIKATPNLLKLCAGSVLLAMAIGSALRCRDWKDSLTLWNDVLHKYPDNSLALNNRGRAYSLLDQPARAIADYDRAIAADPQYDLPYNNRGVAFDKLKEYDKAIADFNRALKINPDLAIAYEGRGTVLTHKGEYLKAITDFDRALQIDPSIDVVYIDLGIAYFNLGQFDRALKEYDRALIYDPYYAETYMHRGDVWFRWGETDRAIADYTKAMKIQPDYPSAYYNRAVAYKTIGEYEKAMADYDRAIALKPDFAEAYNNRGNLLLDQKEYEIALADYDQALRYKPDYAEALYNRAIVYYAVEEFGRAWADLTRARELGCPIDPKFKELLSRKISSTGSPRH